MRRLHIESLLACDLPGSGAHAGVLANLADAPSQNTDAALLCAVAQPRCVRSVKQEWRHASRS